MNAVACVVFEKQECSFLAFLCVASCVVLVGVGFVFVCVCVFL